MIQINKLRIRFISGFSFIPFKLLQWIYTEKNSKFILFFIRVKGQEKIHISSFTKLIFLGCCPILYCAGSASPRLDRPWPHFVIVFFPRCRSFACDFFIGSSWCWIFLWLALFFFFCFVFLFWWPNWKGSSRLIIFIVESSFSAFNFRSHDFTFGVTGKRGLGHTVFLGLT